MIVGQFVALCAVILAVYVTFPLLVGEEARPAVSNISVNLTSLPGGQKTFEQQIVSEDFPTEILSLQTSTRTERDGPVAFAATLPASSGAKASQAHVLEMSNIRGQQIRAWLVKLDDLGEPHATELHLREEKRGIAITLPSLVGEGLRVYGIAKPDRIARVVGSLWDRDAFQISIRSFDQRGAALLGGFLLIAIFSAVLAALNRDVAFLIFAGWSIATLRLITSTGGWDTSWLGLNLSTWSANAVVRVGLASFGLLTTLLFAALFSTQIGTLNRRIIKTLAALFTTFGVVGPWVPSTMFLPVFWALSAATIIYLVSLACRLAIQSRTTVTAWYLLSWICFFCGPFSEILLSVGVISRVPSWLSLQTGGLATALVIAVALAERMRLDRAERLKAQAQAVAAGEELAAHYRSMPIGLFTLDPSGAISTSNPAFREMFATVHPEDRLAHMTLHDMLGVDGVDELLVSVREGRTASGQLEFKSEVCNNRSFQLTLIARDGIIDGAIQDITARVSAEAALARLVDHDMQTNALNQRGLDQAVRVAITAATKGQPCSMADVDIDRFKTLNDLYGHLVGDQLLAAACERILALAPGGVSVARIGDSFKIVMVNRDTDAASDLAQSMHQAISSQPFEVTGRLITATASVGLVPIEPTMSVRDAIATSSQACSEAKSRGRNRLVHLTKEDTALGGYLEELKVQTNLQDKINSHRLYLEFQPIVSLRSAFEELNYEVLVRMRGENGTVISPGRFIPAAERNGQMSLIDRWVLLTTMQWLDEHPDHLQRLNYATINLSGSSLNDGRFVDNLFSMIADFPRVMQKLCFEITETVALADRNSTRRFAERVHSLGSRIALDDFGAGYTSFTYLREIDADIIKIDGSFVRDINQNPANYAITRMIVGLSHELGKHCVAEWAEHPDVISTLMSLGVDYGQGYALARPMAPESLVFAGSGGDLVTDPRVRALLKGTQRVPESVALIS